MDLRRVLMGESRRRRCPERAYGKYARVLNDRGRNRTIRRQGAAQPRPASACGVHRAADLRRSAYRWPARPRGLLSGLPASVLLPSTGEPGKGRAHARKAIGAHWIRTGTQSESIAGLTGLPWTGEGRRWTCVSTTTPSCAAAYRNPMANLVRGHLAEYLVGQALGCLSPERTEWEPYDPPHRHRGAGRSQGRRAAPGMVERTPASQAGLRSGLLGRK